MVHNAMARFLQLGSARGAAAAYGPLEGRLNAVLEAEARRGSAVAASKARHAESAEDLEELETWRQMYAGSVFKPTVPFVRGLVQADHEKWVISCQCDVRRGQTTIAVMVAEGGLYEGAMLCEKVLLKDCIPTAQELTDAALDAMAGSGSETRSQAGPPRRPGSLTLSYRVAAAFEAAKPLLRAVGVRALLEPEESLRAACAHNHTSMTTGMPLHSAASQERDAIS